MIPRYATYALLGTLIIFGTLIICGNPAFAQSETVTDSVTMSPAGTTGYEAAPRPIDNSVPDLPKVSCHFDQLVGMPTNAAEAVVKSTGRPYRILGPDSMATQDFSPARINVEHDGSDIVTRVFCG